MDMKRLIRFPITFMVAGLFVKGILVLLTHRFKSTEVVHVLTTYDPGALTFGDWFASLFFDGRGIAPGPGQAAVFEIAIVAVSALSVCWRDSRRDGSSGCSGPLPM
jgi:hypothetical protein